MRKRKYRPGAVITSLDDLAAQDFVYWNDKITHKGWFMSWQLQMVKHALGGGILRFAMKQEDANGNANE